MKRMIKDYFTFSRKERMAVIVLLLLMSAFIAAPYLYEPRKEIPVVNEDLALFLSSANTAAGDSNAANTIAVTGIAENKKLELFPFDPNTISEDEWLRLGLSAKTIRTLLNYRTKGGRFKSPDDIRKIWGLGKEDADRLVPYVRIAGLADASPAIKETRNVPVQKIISPIDINTATVDEWKSLPGIGDVLAARVVKFRDKAGGFLTVEQVKKTYGISDSLFEAINPFLRFYPSTLPKLNLNTATLNELRFKIGMPYNLAKNIISFREQNGPFVTLADVRKAAQVPDSLYQKMVLLINTE